MFSQHDPDVLYVASNYLHRSRNAGASFEVISPDLTRNDPEKLKPSGGPITLDNTGAEVYCTIFALAESPLQPGLLWAGTDDGLVHISRDGGQLWQDITPPDLPEWALISIIDPSPHEPGAAYLAATRYKLDDTRPYLFKTADYGQTWTHITEGIPADEFTRVIREDPNQPGLLYTGTETSLYISFDDGEHWQRMGGNLPVAPIYDLVIKNRDLVVATHGRSFWILDDLLPLYHTQDGLRPQPAHLFAPGPKVRMRDYGRFSRWYGGQVSDMVNNGNVGTSSAALVSSDKSDFPQFLNAGQNPRGGILFYYYLDVRPEQPLVLNIRSSTGDLVRSYSSDGQDAALIAEPGLQRFHWNLHYPGALDVVDSLASWTRPDGPLVLPENYLAELVVDGEGFSQPFEVLADPRVETSREALAQQRDMLFDIRDRLSQNNELINRLVTLKEQVQAWTRRSDDPAIRAAADAISDAIDDRLPALINIGIAESQLYPSGLHEKLNALFASVDSADYAPPEQAHEVFQQLSAELDGHLAWAASEFIEEVRDFNQLVRDAGLGAVDLLH